MKISQENKDIWGLFEDVINLNKIKTILRYSKNKKNICDEIFKLIQNNIDNIKEDQVKNVCKKLLDVICFVCVDMKDEVEPIDEDKINILAIILNVDDNSINNQIFKLFENMKYPEGFIEKVFNSNGEDVKSESNLYKILIKLKLMKSAIIDDKNDFTIRFINNKTFALSILNRLDNIKKDDENREKTFVKFEIFSESTDLYHIIFITLTKILNNKNINGVLGNFLFRNRINFKEYIEMFKTNNNIIDKNNLIQAINKSNTFQILYQMLNTYLNLKGTSVNIIFNLCIIILIYFTIDKESKRIFFEEEQSKYCMWQLINNPDQDVRVKILTFFKTLIYGFNKFGMIEINEYIDDNNESNNNENKINEKNVIEENRMIKIIFIIN